VSTIPGAPSERTRRQMQRQRTRDTACEIALRSLLFRAGYRYRVNMQIPGAPRCRGDIVFTRQRLVVFVNGCFWHVCEEHQSWPKTNTNWWREKLGRNRERDRAIDRALKATGWKVLRIWEHEEPKTAGQRVRAALRSRHTSVGGNQAITSGLRRPTLSRGCANEIEVLH
jgi:DNA mismatch endonuclease (patch repair protein)